MPADGNNEPTIITSLGSPFNPDRVTVTKPIGALNQVPSTVAQQSPLEFRLHIRRLVDVNYFVTKMNLPAIALPEAVEATPYQDIPQPGDQLNYDPLLIEFRVGEGLGDWMKIWDWMHDIRSGHDYQNLMNHPEYTGYGVKSEILFAILDSSKNLILSVDFHDCWPTALSSPEFDSTLTTVEYQTAVVTFKYSTYEFRKNA